MAMPKTKINRARAGNRRAFYYRKSGLPTTTTCQECGAAKLAHRVCKECGTYVNAKGESLRVLTVDE